MYKSIPRLSLLKAVTNDGLTFSSRNPERIHIFRGCSGVPKKKENAELFGPDEFSFTSFVQHRQNQAKRSVMVKLNKKTDIQKLLNLCSSCGNISNIFHQEDNFVQYLLIEMDGEHSLNSFLDKTQGFQKSFVFSNQFVTFSDNFCLKDSENIFEGDKNLERITGKDVINVNTGSNQQSKFLNRELSRGNVTLNEMIKNCFSCLQVSDFEIRKKFLMCRQVEVMFSGFLPNAVAYPFGSSVTGFGVCGCDLDISLLLLTNCYASALDQNYSLDLINEEAREHLHIISKIISTFMVGCGDLNFIKFAKVPIVKFKNTFINIDCDLSLYNTHGVAVSQIFYNLSSSDWRVKALVIFIKLWANKVGLVSKIPGAKLSNFGLTLLIIFFFQHIKMLPPWNIFHCTDFQFLSEKSSLLSLWTFIKSRDENNTSLEEFFVSFLKFYESFDFTQNAISLREGITFKKQSAAPMFIQNPIYPNINVTHNVNKSTVLQIQRLFAEALKILSDGDKRPLKRLFRLNIKEKV